MMALLIPLALLLSGAPTAVEHVAIEGLSPGCAVEKTWYGVVPEMPSALWLVCGGQRFLITEPKSFVGHITITSPERALSFVRFFSSATSERYIRPNGMLEIVPAAPDDARPGAINEATFRKHFRPAVAKAIGISGVSALQMFEVRRTVLTPSGAAVEVTETVREDGYCDIANRRTVMKDASRIGLYYLGD